MDAFAFAGVSSTTYLLKVLNVKRRFLPAIENEIVKVPGRVGDIDFGARLGSRAIEIEFAIPGGTESEYVSLLRGLAGWLNPLEGISQLILSDEPDKFYYARVSDVSELDQIAATGKGTVTFVCYDPCAYSQRENSVTLDTSTATANVTNPGTVDTYPVIDITFTQKVPYFIIATPTEYLMLGDPDNAEQQKIDAYELMLWDEFVDISTWATGTYVDGGVVAGNFAVQSGDWYIYPQDYGTGTTWHGPAIQKGLGGPLQNFEVQLIFQLNNTVANNALGRVEVYLLDINGTAFGKIAAKDVDGFSPTMSLEARAGTLAGGYYFVNNPQAYMKSLNNLAGYMKIGRVGKTWYAFWGKIEPYFSGKVTTNTGWKYWTDTKGTWNNYLLGAIQIHAGAYSTYPACGVRIDDVKVYKRNTATTTQIQYVCNAGDNVVIDCYRAEVRKNKQVDFTIVNPMSRFIKLPPGTTPITVYPTGVATVKITYRGRWL